MTDPQAERRRLLLIVEDDPEVAHLLERFLGQDYDVERAADGPGALAAATRRPPDLFLVDVMIPGFDGFGLAERLKLVPETKNTPVIFITARAGSDDRIKGIMAGARSYITKPFKLQDVRDKVKKALGT